MAVNPNPPAAPADPPATPPASSDATKNTDTAGKVDAEHMIPKSRLDEESNKRKEAEKELATLRAKEAERARLEQETADEAARKRGEFEKLAETEKARAQKLEADLNAEREARKADRVRHEVLVVAQRLGAVDPDVTYRLLDLSQVELGDDGAPKNVEALLKALLDAKPYLKAAANGSNGAAVPATPKADSGKGLSEQQIKDAQQREAGRYALRF